MNIDEFHRWWAIFGVSLGGAILFFLTWFSVLESLALRQDSADTLSGTIWWVMRHPGSPIWWLTLGIWAALAVSGLALLAHFLSFGKVGLP